MSEQSKIAWTDTTWNPLAGCSKASSGCRSCYAEKMAGRLARMGQANYASVVKWQSKASGLWYDDHRAAGSAVAHWNGKVRLVPEKLAEPLKWRKPRRVFVNSMSDLFHEDVPFEYVDRVFAVMALSRQHTFQVLTKRAARMREYFDSFKSPKAEDRGWDCADWLYGVVRREHLRDAVDTVCGSRFWCGLPNVWMGVSVEDQPRADERIPHLLATPAAVRFVSCEPLIGAVDLSAFISGPYVALPGDRIEPHFNAGLSWVIAGGESGPGARPMDLAWARSIVRQCREAGTPVFMKQAGAMPVQSVISATGPAAIEAQRAADREWPEGVRFGNPTGDASMNGRVVLLRHPKGGDPQEWPDDLRVREMPEVRT